MKLSNRHLLISSVLEACPASPSGLAESRRRGYGSGHTSIHSLQERAPVKPAADRISGRLALERREFLKGATQAAGAVAWTAASASRILGANDRIRMGQIGCGGRGRYVARCIKEAPNVDFVALADAYLPNAEKSREWAGSHSVAVQDFRRVLDRKDVDAVLVATPDHWHAIPTIMAVEAGKDVYVEKPLAHNIHEGRAMVEAARKHNRIVQSGTQQRSATHFPELAQIIGEGKIGKVRFVRVWNFTNIYPEGIGTAPDSDPPEGLDWDLWLGPAPQVPFNPKRFLSTYRYFSDYSGGYITDFGTHRFDTVHQIMGEEKPVSVSATGGRYVVGGMGDVPDVLQVTYEYPGFVMSYEALNTNSHGVGGRTPGMKYYHGVGPDNRPHGMAFYGTEGSIIADRIGFDIYPEVKRDGTATKVDRRWHNTTDATPLHGLNFIENLRARRKPFADVEVGHHAAIIAHLGNIALRTNRKLKWDPEAEKFPGDNEANQMLRRQARKPWDLV
jgi:predicted dehydrogenase